MNKRQKKKLFKKRIGNNPRKELRFRSECYCHIIGKPWTGRNALKRQQETSNIETFNIAMTKRRKRWKSWIRSQRR